MVSLSKEILEAANRAGTNLPEFVSNVTTLSLICSAIIGVIMWSIIHSTFIRPFILVGVLRNFINSGRNYTPTAQDMAELDKKSKKFAELRAKA